jgi:hypothetical protein
MNLALLVLVGTVLSSCSSSLYTKDKDGKLIYANTERLNSETPAPSTPYPVFVPPLAGVQPDIVSGPVKRAPNSYPVYIPTAPGTQGLAPIMNVPQ